MFQNGKQIISRTKQWEIYNNWEATSQKAMEEPDLAKTLQWYSSAWEMAQAQNPSWSRQEVDQAKVCRLQKIRGVLALIGGTYERP